MLTYARNRTNSRGKRHHVPLLLSFFLFLSFPLLFSHRSFLSLLDNDSFKIVNTRRRQPTHPDHIPSCPHCLSSHSSLSRSRTKAVNTTVSRHFPHSDGLTVPQQPFPPPLPPVQALSWPVHSTATRPAQIPLVHLAASLLGSGVL